MTRFISRTAMTLALLTLVVFPLRAQDQGNEQDQGGPSVKGAVSDVSGSTIKLLNGLVVVDASKASIVSDKNDKVLKLADLKVGTMIDVSGIPGKDGTISASQIQVHGPRFDGEIQGKIDSVDLSKGVFSILGIPVVFGSSTIFEAGNEGENTAAFGPNNLAAGMAVSVEVAVFQGTDAHLHLFATRISLEGGDSNDESKAQRLAAYSLDSTEYSGRIVADSETIPAPCGSSSAVGTVMFGFPETGLSWRGLRLRARTALPTTKPDPSSKGSVG